MASFDNCTEGGYISSTTSTTFSWTHTVGSGANRLLFVSVHTYGASTNPVTGITYNGVAMTLVNASAQDGDGLEWMNVYALPAPASGANTVAVTLNTTSLQIDGFAASYADCDQTNYAEATSVSQHASTFPTDYTWSPSISVPNVNDWVITFDQPYYGESTVNSGGTKRGGSASGLRPTIIDSNGVIGATGTYTNPSLTTSGGGGASTDIQVAFRSFVVVVTPGQIIFQHA